MRLKIGLLILSALLLSLSILIPYGSFLAFIAFVSFFAFIDQTSTQKAFLSGVFLGVVYFSTLFIWIPKYELKIFFLVLFVATPFLALTGSLIQILWQRTNPILRILIPPISWSVVFFIYSFTPFDTLGNLMTFLVAPYFPGILRTIGVSGLTFTIFLTNSFIYHALKYNHRTAKIGFFVICLMLLLTSYSKIESKNSSPLTFGIVQHNFPIQPEWRFQNKEFVLTSYEKSIRSLAHRELIVFPQFGLPIDALREPELFNRLANETKSSILLATYLPKEPGGSLESGRRTDSALLFSPNNPVQEYQAVTPPPFRHIGQIKGSGRRPFKIKNILVGIMLCYEDTRPEEARTWILNGAEILFALSNPGHFLGTELPSYHLAQDQIRAAETGKYIVRASPNGYSAIIDPNGRIITKSGLAEKVIISGMVYPNSDKTIFVRYGYLFSLVMGLAGLGLIAYYALNSIKRLALNIR